MRHLLVGATLLVVAIAATFGLASVLQGYATAPLRMAPAPLANEPDQRPAGKPPSGEPSRSGPSRRATL
jgi:hypothetical protein